MKYSYFIKGTINGGFWDNKSCSFRGFLFATKYLSIDCESILIDIKFATKGSPCEIVKIYYQ